MSSLDLAVIGNSSVAALIDSRARIVFASMPRLDSDPVFCSLLRGGDAAGVNPADGAVTLSFETVANKNCPEKSNCKCAPETASASKPPAAAVSA